jgi:hypothetical protein
LLPRTAPDIQDLHLGGGLQHFCIPLVDVACSIRFMNANAG